MRRSNEIQQQTNDKKKFTLMCVEAFSPQQSAASASGRLSAAMLRMAMSLHQSNLERYECRPPLRERRHAEVDARLGCISGGVKSC